jgi:hypothetical protein
MIRAVCFCNTWIETDAAIAICPKCGEYTTTLSVTAQEKKEMEDDLALLFRLVELDLL